jgi:fibronectin type 3 domain-containing protein
MAVLALAAASRALAVPADVAVFANGAFVETCTSSECETTNVIAALQSGGFTVTTFTDYDPTTILAAFASSSVVAIPEQELASLYDAMSTSARDALRNAVTSGGRLVVFGTTGSRASQILSSVLGSTITYVGNPSCMSSASLNSAAASATAFEGGPASIGYADATNSITGWPAAGRVLYGTGTCCWVATAPVGAGAIGYIAYDFYSTAQAGAALWIDVTRRMIHQFRAGPASFTYDSPLLSPFNWGAPAGVTIPNAPAAIGTVQFSFNLNADLNAAAECFDVRINGALVGTAQATGVECLPSAAAISVSAAAFNAARGSSSSINVQLVPSAEVNWCTGSVSFSVAYPAQATASFSHTSASISPFMYGSNATYTVASAPAALGNVTMEFLLNGDFDYSNESFEVRLNGALVSTVTPAALQCGASTRTLTIPAATFNAARAAAGTLTVQLVPSASVDFCSGSVQTSIHYFAAIPPVSGVTASDGGSASGVQVAWDAHPNALGYSVWRRPATGAAVQIGVLTGGSSNTFTDSTAVALTQYWYHVVALAGGGAFPPSAENTGWRNIVGPAASASDGTYSDRVQVSWSATSGSTGYRIYRALDGGTPSLLASVASSVTSYADTTASPGVSYTYLLSSVHTLGESLLGTPNSGFRSFSAPIGVSATDGTSASGVTIAWSAFPSATGYSVWRRTGTSAVVQIGTTSGGSSTSFTDTAGSSLTTHYYSVRAIVGSTSTGFSAENAGWRNVNGPTASASDGSHADRISITWSSVTGNSGYRLYRWAGSESPSLLTALSSTSTSYSDYGAAPGVVYSYALSYMHVLGESLLGAANSGYRSTTVPTNVVASDGTSATAVTISWNGVPSATSYSVYRRVGSGTATVIATTTATSISYTSGTTLSNDGYSVRAVIGGVVGGWSVEDTGWRNINGPGASASDGTYGDRVQVTWSSVTGSQGYRLYRWTGSNSPVLLASLTSSAVTYSDTTAVAGTVYSYALTTLHSLGESLAGVSNTGYRSTTVPQAVAASDGTSSSAVVVTWQSVPNATSYLVFRRSGTTAAVQVGSVSSPATSFSHTTAAALSSGYYSVKSVIGGVSSTASAEDTGWRNINGPAVTASDGSYTDRVQLTWSPTSGATSHRVYRWASGGSATLIASLTATASSYGDTSASAGTIYSYAIATTHALGESLLGSVDTGYRLQTVPQNVVASDGTSASTVTVAWSAVQNAGSYQVYRRGTTGTASLLATVSATVTSFSHSSATALSLGYYSVRAVVGGLTSPPSTEDAGWRNVVGPGATASDGTYSDRVQVTWAAVPGAVGHRVYRWQSSGTPVQIAVLSATASSYADTSAVPGTVYNYAIAYAHPLGESLLGTSNSGHRLQTVPQNVIASDGASATSVLISWNGVPGAASYLVYRRTASGALTQIGSVTSSSNSFTYTSGPALTVDSYGVKAVIGTTTGALSAEDTGWRNVTGPTVTASDGTHLDRVQLSWTPATGVTGHRIYRWTGSAGATLLAAVSSTASSYADTSAAPGTTYVYEIRTTHALGESMPGVSNSGYRGWTIPQSVAASDGSSSSNVTVTWQAVPGASGYQVYRRSTGGTPSLIGTVSGGVLSYTDSTAGTLVAYYYTVRSVIGSSVSSPSVEDLGWRNTVAVTGVSATDGAYSTHVRVTWFAHSSATGYKVFRQQSGSSYVQIAAVSATTLAYNDYTIPQNSSAFYYVVATHALGQTNPSVANSGYRSLGLADGEDETGAPIGSGALDVPVDGIAEGRGPSDDLSGSESGEGSGSDATSPINPDGSWSLTPSEDCPQAIRSIKHMVRLFRRGSAPYAIGADTLDALRATLPPEGDYASGGDEATESCDACRMLAGDVNLDGEIDLLDADAQLAAWESGDLIRGDVNRDGWIDILDHLRVLDAIEGQFGQD